MPVDAGTSLASGRQNGAADGGIQVLALKRTGSVWFTS